MQIMNGNYFKIIIIIIFLTSCSVDKNLNKGTIITGITFAGVAKASKFSWSQSATIGITSALFVYTLNKIFKNKIR